MCIFIQKQGQNLRNTTKNIFEVIKRSISHLTSSIIPSSLSSDYAFPQGLLLRVITVRFGLILHFLIFLSGQVPFSH